MKGLRRNNVQPELLKAGITIDVITCSELTIK